MLAARGLISLSSTRLHPTPFQEHTTVRYPAGVHSACIELHGAMLSFDLWLRVIRMARPFQAAFLDSSVCTSTLQYGSSFDSVLSAFIFGYVSFEYEES